MIGKVTRGQKVDGLLRYLFGPGRFNEHVEPHLVAAWDDDLESLEPLLTSAGGYSRFDIRALAAALNAPLEVIGSAAPTAPVWQASLRVAPGDRTLNDEEWADIARDAIARVGLAKPGDDGGVRWLAVRHADDHVHLVATLARQDGRSVRLFRDFLRLREAGQAAEAKYGLQSTAPADGTAAGRPHRAETEKAARAGADESVRETLRREVRLAAGGAPTEADFWRRLEVAGVTVKHRYSERNPGEITGYAVGLSKTGPATAKAGMSSDGQVLLFSGGKLAPDLSLPKLRVRWRPADKPLGQSRVLTGEERQKAWEHITAVAGAGAEHVREHVATGQYDQAADAAWATSDVLGSAARVLENDEPGPLQAAADDYDRAARQVYRRAPSRSESGTQLRMAAVMLGLLARSDVSDAAAATLLTMRLVQLVRAVAELRDAQQRAAQAAAARKAAETVFGLHQGLQQLSGISVPQEVGRNQRLGGFTPVDGLQLSDDDAATRKLHERGAGRGR